MTRKTAVPIYCGMMTDTGGFTYNSSRPGNLFHHRTVLLTKGIDKDKIIVTSSIIIVHGPFACVDMSCIS